MVLWCCCRLRLHLCIVNLVSFKTRWLSKLLFKGDLDQSCSISPSWIMQHRALPPTTQMIDRGQHLHPPKPHISQAGKPSKTGARRPPPPQSYGGQGVGSGVRERRAILWCLKPVSCLIIIDIAVSVFWILCCEKSNVLIPLNPPPPFFPQHTHTQTHTLPRRTHLHKTVL